MYPNSHNKLLSLVLLTTVAFTAACGDSAPTPAQTPVAATVTLPTGIFVTAEPNGAVPVLEARKSAKVGDRVALLGRIGGTRAPFVSDRAVFSIIDASLKSCVEMGDDDHCPRPWDYCCEDKSARSAAMASIEIDGADGKPLALALEQEGTLKPLMLVAVEGTLHSTDGGAFVVRAEHIYKVPNDSLAKYIK